MQAWTLGDIQTILSFLAGIIGSGTAVYAFIKKHFNSAIQEQLKPTNEKLDNVAQRLKQVELDNCKNYLVKAISDLDAGEKFDKVSLERFYENYDKYTNAGGNSYIHSSVDRLKKEGKL